MHPFFPDGPITLEGATVTLNSQGFLLIRFFGWIHDVKLSPSEFEIFQALEKGRREQQEEIRAKSAGAVNGWKKRAAAAAAK